MLRSILLLIPFLLGSSMIECYTPPFTQNDPCYKNAGRNFFSYDPVTKALDLYRQYQSRWTPIYTTLQEKSDSLIARMHAKIKNPSRNPFYYPPDRKEIYKLMVESLSDIFSETLREYGTSDDLAIQRMFNELMRIQSPQLRTCLRL